MAAAGSRSDAYPAQGSIRDRLWYLLRYARLAPSTHNTQTWIFKLVGDVVEVHADRSRALPNIDPDQRELTMSVGTAIDHLTLAMSCHGIEPSLEIICESKRPDLFATISSLGPTIPTPEQERRFAEVERRHTFRGVFDNRPVDSHTLASLTGEAAQEGAVPVFVTDERFRHRIEEMVRAGDERLLARPEYRREVGHWVRASRSGDDGIPATTLGVGPIQAKLAPWALSHIDLGGVKASIDGEQIARAPALAIVWTQGDSVADRIHAGISISRLTLAASARGLRCSFYLQPIHFDEYRLELREAAHEQRYPQIVIRLGYADVGEATPRRPLDDMLVERRERKPSSGGHQT